MNFNPIKIPCVDCLLKNKCLVYAWLFQQELHIEDAIKPEFVRKEKYAECKEFIFNK